MISSYKRLVLDPRCLKPSYEVNDVMVYTDALLAVDLALNTPDIMPSEKAVLEATKLEIRKNKFAVK
jgi:hypothetical protein